MTITLHENFRAVFYAPFYAAHALDAYAAEGLDVRLETSSSPGPTARGRSGDQIGVWWGGPMRLLVEGDRDPDNNLVGFCEVVTRDPFFVVGRAPRPEFGMADLLECRLGTVSEVPTPWMCLQDDLRRAGLDPAAVDRVADRSMADNVAALEAGDLDAVQVFQPFAERLSRAGTGHIWTAAAARGPTSYTSFYAERRTLDERRDEMLAMTRAIHRTQKWLHAADSRTVAAALAEFFPDFGADLLGACIARYKSLGLWGRDPLLPEDGFERLKAACLSGGLIQRGANYRDCVDNSLAEAVIRSDPPPM